MTTPTAPTGASRRQPRTFVAPTEETPADIDTQQEELDGAEVVEYPEDETTDDETTDDEAPEGIDVEATRIEIDPAPNGDCFEATLLLAQDDEAIGVWVRLTPPVIEQLQQALDGVSAAQHEAMGVIPRPTNGREPTEDDEERDELEETDETGVLDKVRDPLRLSRLKASPVAMSIAVAAVIAVIVLLAVFR